MTVTLPTGRTVKLNFIHSSPDFKTKDGATGARMAIDELAREMGRRLTSCEISQVGFSGSTEPGSVTDLSYASLGIGIAVCHPNDTFDKALGRKYSVEKALVAAELDYEERAAVWAAYRLEFTGPTVAQILRSVGANIDVLVASDESEAVAEIARYALLSVGEINSRGRIA